MRRAAAAVLPGAFARPQPASRHLALHKLSLPHAFGQVRACSICTCSVPSRVAPRQALRKRCTRPCTIHDTPIAAGACPRRPAASPPAAAGEARLEPACRRWPLPCAAAASRAPWRSTAPLSWTQQRCVHQRHAAVSSPDRCLRRRRQPLQLALRCPRAPISILLLPGCRPRRRWRTCTPQRPRRPASATWMPCRGRRCLRPC